MKEYLNDPYKNATKQNREFDDSIKYKPTDKCNSNIIQ